MPIPTKGPRLGGSPAHQKAILANLAVSLFEHGSITTTEAKARRLRPFAERLISKAKRGDLHNRRQVLSAIRDKTVVHVLFTEIGPRYAERPGGYTRITKIGPRKGDNAPMAVIALVEAEMAAPTRPSRPARAAAAPAAASATHPVDEQIGGGESVGGQVGAADEQVAAQDAVAAQEPQGETVGVVADASEDAGAVDETEEPASVQTETANPPAESLVEQTDTEATPADAEAAQTDAEANPTDAEATPTDAGLDESKNDA